METLYVVALVAFVIAALVISGQKGNLSAKATKTPPVYTYEVKNRIMTDRELIF